MQVEGRIVCLRVYEQKPGLFHHMREICGNISKRREELLCIDTIYMYVDIEQIGRQKCFLHITD